MPLFLDVLFGVQARVIRAGATSLRAGFAITNMMIDSIESSLQTEYGNPLTVPGRSAIATLRRFRNKDSDKMVQLYKRSGVEMSNELGLDQKSLKRAADRVIGDPVLRGEFNILEHPIQLLSIIARAARKGARGGIEGYKKIISIPESGPRLAEFEKTYKYLEAHYGKEGAFIGASNAAADVSINFRRAGVYGQWANKIIPFFNVAIQGPAKFARFAKDHPVKAGLRGVAMLTLPTFILWWMHKDDEWYRESPDWLKYNFWQFPFGGTDDKPEMIVRIKRPFTWSMVFASGPEMMWNYMYDGNETEFKKSMEHLVSEQFPSVMPATIKTPVELWANYDFWRDRQIVPYWEAKTKDPEDQYSKYSTETSKFLGKQFGLSPRKIEHAAYSSTGGLAMDAIRATEGTVNIARGKKKSEDYFKQQADYPVVGRLFVRQRSEDDRIKGINYERKELVAQIKRLGKKGSSEKKRAEQLRKDWNTKYPDFKIRK